MEQSATFTCQLCRARLTLVGNLDGAIADAGASTAQRSPGFAAQQHLHASVFDNANVDESFIVLDGRRQGVQHLQRGLEESFVMLGAASLLRPPPGSLPPGAAQALAAAQQHPHGSPHQQHQHQQGQAQQPGGSAPLPSPSSQQQQPDMGGLQPSGSDGGGGVFGLDAKLQALAQLFELASTQTQVDQPLCMDCVGQLKEEIDTQIAEAQAEINAYSACVARLEAEAAAGAGASASSADPAAAASTSGSGGAPRSPGRAAGGCGAISDEELLEEVSRLEQERDRQRRRAEALEAELAGVLGELASLDAASLDLDALEERYWHDVNDYGLHLRSHVEERDSLLAKIDRARQRLQLLRHTSVLNDAFKIWHDGPFGTISGFRLGRTPEVPVEWDEINAAWGQAVLLLHTMAQSCGLQFSQYRLLPMGSHPRISDKRSTYDLFGPVNKLWSANYDRAMVSFLACLRELGEHARRKDAADGKGPAFQFPFAIDGDKVNGATVKLSLNKDARWTKALKFMLADLKVLLQWCVKQEQADGVPQQLQALQPEGLLH